ncbi:MAG: CBS domain-containing protein [Desulfomonile tiedjei]|nr:CBS domain-containing protein [Desulfomonile tiedjei]
MLVKDWMSTNVITIDVKATLQDAINMMMEHDIGLLPVMEEGKLVGVVTDRDVKHASPSDACLLDFQNIMYHVARLQVGSFMSQNPVTVPLNLTIEETAEVLMQHDISGAPVVDDAGHVRGIITKNDLFAALISMTGLAQKGVSFGFQVQDNAGSIKAVTDVIRKYGGRLVSIVSTYETAPQGYRQVYVRAFNLDRNTFPELVQELQKLAQVLYTVDHRDNTREFFAA